MRYYVALESLMLPQSQASTAYAIPEDLKNEFEAYIVDLYQHILSFQIRSVLRFYRSALGNFGRDLIQKENWKQMHENIKNLEKIVYDDSQQISTLYSRRTLENLAQEAEISCQTLQQFLAVAEQHLQVSKRQLSVHKQMLKALEVKNKRALSKDEEKCL